MHSPRLRLTLDLDRAWPESRLLAVGSLLTHPPIHQASRSTELAAQGIVMAAAGPDDTHFVAYDTEFDIEVTLETDPPHIEQTLRVLDHIRVLRSDRALLIPLPPRFWAAWDIPGFACRCAYCRHQPTYRDTLVISTQAPPQGSWDHTSMCHGPEYQRRSARLRITMDENAHISPARLQTLYALGMSAWQTHQVPNAPQHVRFVPRGTGYPFIACTVKDVEGVVGLEVVERDRPSALQTRCPLSSIPVFYTPEEIYIPLPRAGGSDTGERPLNSLPPAPDELDTLVLAARAPKAGLDLTRLDHRSQDHLFGMRMTPNCAMTDR